VAGDEGQSRELLVLLLRTVDTSAAEPPTPEVRDGQSVLGPLLEREVERIGALLPEALVVDREGTAWLCAERSDVFWALSFVRLLELESIAETEREGEGAKQVLRHTLDRYGVAAAEKLIVVIRDAAPWAANRAATVLAERQDAAVGLLLAKLALEGPAEARGRAYRALARGQAFLEPSHSLLLQALSKEKPELREHAFMAFARVATDQDLSRLRLEAQADVRALAFLTLAQRSIKRSRGNTRPIELVREALADPAAELRRAAVRVLAAREWEKEPRAQGWLMGRLLDADRTVRIEALRLLRRRQLPAKVAPRLRTIARGAPPSLRAPIERLAERIDR
jgi:hypothetical protein